MKTIQKRQIIQLMGVFSFLFSGITGVYGQFHNQSLLVNRVWKSQIPGKNYYITSFYTDKEQILNFYLNGVREDVETKSSYYLSDEIVSEFQPGSVGINKSGKYIVILYIPKPGKELLELYEILELTDTTLKIKHLRSGSVLEYIAQ